MPDSLLAASGNDIWEEDCGTARAENGFGVCVCLGLLTCLFLYFAKDSEKRWFHSMTVERMFSDDDEEKGMIR